VDHSYSMVEFKKSCWSCIEIVNASYLSFESTGWEKPGLVHNIVSLRKKIVIYWKLKIEEVGMK
jgi:hypothetical protein